MSEKKYRAVCGGPGFFPLATGEPDFDNDHPDSRKLPWTDTIEEANKAGAAYCSEINSHATGWHMVISYYIEDDDGNVYK